jgi:hypothetical protein
MARFCSGVTEKTRPKFPQHAEIDSNLHTMMAHV